jgi:glutamine synthetase
LENEREKASKISDTLKRGTAFRDKVLAVMTDLRENIDTLETIVPRKLWPVPTYADLLFKL